MRLTAGRVVAASSREGGLRLTALADEGEFCKIPRRTLPIIGPIRIQTAAFDEMLPKPSRWRGEETAA